MENVIRIKPPTVGLCQVAAMSYGLILVSSCSTDSGIMVASRGYQANSARRGRLAHQGRNRHELPGLSDRMRPRWGRQGEMSTEGQDFTDLRGDASPRLPRRLSWAQAG